MNDSELGVGIASVNGGCVIGDGEGRGNGRRGNYVTSANSSSHAESSTP